MDAKRDAIAAKIRGCWIDNGGSRWRVTADLKVQGVPKQGDKIKDRIEIQTDRTGAQDVARLGPFVLDMAKSHGGCFWVQPDNSSCAMIWRSDRQLLSRKLFMW